MLTKPLAVAAGALALVVPLDHDLAYGVEANTTLTRTIRTSGELEMEFAFLMNGEEQDVGAEAIELAWREELVFVDTIEKVGDAGPARFVREHRTLDTDRTIDTPDETIEEVMTSPLQGESVVFEWDEEEGEWTASLPEDSESELDSEILDDLRADLALVGLLPDRSVAVGDSWPVGLDLYYSLNWPGGILPYLGEEEEERDPYELEGSRQRFANTEAEGTAKLEAVEEGVATVSVVFEASTSAEVEMEVEAEEGVPLDSVTRVQELTTELEVEILWDLEAGRWTSYSITDSTEATMDEVAIFTAPDGEELEMTQRRSFGGESTIEATSQ